MVGVSRVAVGVAAIVTTVALGGPLLAAENDPYGSFVSEDGTVWVTMSVDEYLAQPVVQQMQQRMESVASHSFRAGDDFATDDDPQPRWSVVRQGKVTRYLTRKGRTRTVEYVGPRKVCRRKAPPGTAFSIASDKEASWRCRGRNATSLDAPDYASQFFPYNAVLDVDPTTARVLLTQDSLAGIDDSGEVELRVIIKPASVLAGVGLKGGPGEFFDYYADQRSLTTQFDEFNGLSWNIGEFQLSRAGAPRLPSAVTTLVR